MCRRVFLQPQRPRFAAPHAQRSKLKASVSNALLGIGSFLGSHRYELWSQAECFIDVRVPYSAFSNDAYAVDSPMRSRNGESRASLQRNGNEASTRFSSRT